MTYIIFDSKLIYNNTITLLKGQVVQTNKKASKGRWYYEFTHINGTSYHYAGFKIGNYEIDVYPQGNENYLKVTFNSLAIKENYANFQNIGFTGVIKKHTVGLSFDSYSRIFSVYYENQLQKFTIATELSETKVSPYIGVSGSSNPNDYFIDTVNMNFGEKQFKYEVPYGYIPWNKNNERHSCHCHKKTHSFNVLFIVLMLIS